MGLKVRGSFVALITPFDQKGKVDTTHLRSLVEWHLKEGTDGIVCCATTGEGPALETREKKKIAQICIETVQKKIPVVVSTGTADTRSSVRLTEEMARLGADGCLVVTPYYNKPSQQGCILHFQEVARVGLPVVIYHNPARAVVRLSAETIALLGRTPGIVGIKESSHDLELIRKIRSLSSIAILSGEDDLTVETIREGGVGSISVASNLLPRGWKSMIQWALEGNWEKAQSYAKRYRDLCRALFLDTNPQPVKFALAWMKRCLPVYRLPMLEPREETKKVIRQSFYAMALPLLYPQKEPVQH